MEPIMDSLSSPTSNSSSTTTAPISASTQPTYTTAGTIYNPSSSLPLQPPTRRGRSAKWAVGCPASELALFPKSVLASLSIKATAGRPPSTLQQYTPLQQNYDRAVSPPNDVDHARVDMSIQPPRMRSGNTPAPPSFVLADKDDDKEQEKDVFVVEEQTMPSNDADDDDDNHFNMDTLMNMTVKSLNNLASYPNPIQKRAQKALLRGSRPNLTPWASPSILIAPVPPPRAMGSPDEPKRDDGCMPPPFLLPESVDPPMDTSHAPSRLFQTARPPSPGSTAEPIDTVSTSTMLATGPGAPRPLTAGQPGQRQYRPSTFESTFKALQIKSQAQDFAKEESDRIAIAKQTLAQLGLEDFANVTWDFLPSADIAPHRPRKARQNIP